ncbi:MAG: alpha/beta hydrolase [Clostridia bacterium]
MKIVWIILAIVIAIAIILVLIASVAFLAYVARRNQFKIFEKPLSKLSEKIDGDEKYSVFYAEAKKRETYLNEQPLEIVEQKSHDGLKLVGRIYASEQKSNVVVLACHGCRSSGVSEFAFHSQYYHKKGFDMLLVDNRACGDSEGKYMTYGLKEARDNMLWIKYILNRYGDDVKIILHGISMGAATVLIMSGMDLPKNVVGIISESSYTSAFDEFKHQMKSALNMSPFPFLYTMNLMGILIAKCSYRKVSPLEAVKKSRTKTLFMHGGNDNYVPIEMDEKLVEACAADAELHIVDGCIHARCYQTKPDECEELFNSFIAKIL